MRLPSCAVLAAAFLFVPTPAALGAGSSLPLGRYAGTTNDGHPSEFTVERSAKPGFPQRPQPRQPVAAVGAATVSCNPVVNPYPGTRYEGADLRRIRATGVSCTSARKVVRGAHRKALGITPPVSGVRHFAWNGWKITGDLRGSSDSYVAARGSKRVRWVF